MQIVFVLFVPALSFTCLAESVTLKDLISWWFMPVNLAITFFSGAALGWIAAMILKPGSHLHGLIIACCSGGNWGTLPLIIVPALCNEPQSPFQKASDCDSKGLSYVSLSMALGNILIWTHCYYVMERSAKIHKRLCRESSGSSKTSEVSHHSYVVREEDKGDYETLLPPSTKVDYDEWNCKNDTCVEAETNSRRRLQKFWNNFKKSAKNVMGFLLSPPTIAGFIGLFVGAIPTLKSLIAGENAPLHVIQDSLKLLGDAAIPCTILILGGNLSKGIRKSAMKPLVVVAITAIRYVILPICGIGVVTGADKLGYLPESPLFKYVLLIQFTVPPAMSLGTIAQLFEVGEEECSVIFFWTYLIAAIALTVWSMVFMSILLKVYTPQLAIGNASFFSLFYFQVKQVAFSLSRGVSDDSLIISPCSIESRLNLPNIILCFFYHFMYASTIKLIEKKTFLLCNEINLSWSFFSFYILQGFPHFVNSITWQLVLIVDDFTQ